MDKREGRYVLVRCDRAGVHVGTLDSQDEVFLTLRSARRIWYWRGAASCSEIAVHGINPRYHSENKICVEVGSVRVRQDDIKELISVTEEARENIAEIKPWRA